MCFQFQKLKFKLKKYLKVEEKNHQNYILAGHGGNPTTKRLR
jgi:hypothetical protein